MVLGLEPRGNDMKLIRFGNPGAERPGLLAADGVAYRRVGLRRGLRGKLLRQRRLATPERLGDEARTERAARR